MLGDAARFGFGNGGVANRIQKGGFAVVDVAHNTNDRVAFDQIFFGVFGIVDDAFLNGHDNLFFDLCAEFGGDNRRRVVVNHFVDGCHLPQREQLFNDFCRGHFQPRSKFADGDFIGNRNFNLLFRTFGGNARHTLFFGFVLAATHTLFSVLLRFLF